MNCIDARVEAMEKALFCRPLSWKGLGVFVSFDGVLGGVPFDKLSFSPNEQWETLEGDVILQERDYLRGQELPLPTRDYLQQLLFKRVVKGRAVRPKTDRSEQATKDLKAILESINLSDGAIH